jgi:hypothetical protein
MSRGIVAAIPMLAISFIAGVTEKLVDKFQAMAKVGFPKGDGLLPISVLDSVPAMSEYPPVLPGLESLGQLDTVSPLAQEYPVSLESFMPLVRPVPTPREHVSREPVIAALPHKKVLELPTVSQVPAQREPIKKTLGADDLRDLLAALEGTGMKVKEVKSLPSGATRVTFDEFMGSRKQPDLVRVGGQR